MNQIKTQQQVSDFFKEWRVISSKYEKKINNPLTEQEFVELDITLEKEWNNLMKKMLPNGFKVSNKKSSNEHGGSSNKHNEHKGSSNEHNEHGGSRNEHKGSSNELRGFTPLESMVDYSYYLDPDYTGDSDQPDDLY